MLEVTSRIQRTAAKRRYTTDRTGRSPATSEPGSTAGRSSRRPVISWSAAETNALMLCLALLSGGTHKWGSEVSFSEKQ
jgi:hypothetical protein